ncbi:MarR family transcriptional regulator [Archangium violaceum]|uniref:MarR family winged helix-turn-helix transcriptional regulator n=1 Tax=Archangium violaceum TaxID=83451 RepID=UPI002B31B1EE|nr:MarR family transcriptional regulator [Archangium violaceum]
MGTKLEGRQSAGHLTTRAARLFIRAIDVRLKKLGLSSGQLPVFFALSSGEEMSQKELVEFAAIEQPTMAATLTRMERDGLVERHPDPRDGRGSLIRLTPLAMKKTRDVMATIQTSNAEALAGFSDAEKELYLGMLRRIIANLEAD